MNNAEAGADFGEGLSKEILSSLLMDSIGDLIGIVGLVMIMVAVVRLYRSTSAPGVNYLFYSMVLMLAGIILPLAAYYLSGGEESWGDESPLFDAIFNIYTGVVLVLGAYGFWKLTGHVIASHAEK